MYVYVYGTRIQVWSCESSILCNHVCIRVSCPFLSYGMSMFAALHVIEWHGIGWHGMGWYVMLQYGYNTQVLDSDVGVASN